MYSSFIWCTKYTMLSLKAVLNCSFLPLISHLFYKNSITCTVLTYRYRPFFPIPSISLSPLLLDSYFFYQTSISSISHPLQINTSNDQLLYYDRQKYQVTITTSLQLVHLGRNIYNLFLLLYIYPSEPMKECCCGCQNVENTASVNVQLFLPFIFTRIFLVLLSSSIIFYRETDYATAP